MEDFFGAHIARTVLVCALALAAEVAASTDPPEPALPDPATAIQDDAPPDDTSSARRLNRAWAEHEARRAEATARREAETARENEINRARGASSGYARRESFLRHDSYWQQREFDWITRDPADISAMARRGAVERDLRDTRSQLESAISGRQDSLRQLDTLRIR
jgi:hypothetical protein